MYKVLKVIFLYFPDSFVERTVIVIHRCYVVLNITLHCFTLSVSIDFKRIRELQKKREPCFLHSIGSLLKKVHIGAFYLVCSPT